MTRTDCRGDPIPEGFHEFAFDVKLFAVVRVVAPNIDIARAAMRDVIDCMEPTGRKQHSQDDDGNVNSVVITEVSLEEDGEDENEEPFEIDGEVA